MATERISSKSIVESAPIVISDNNPESIFFNPSKKITPKAGGLLEKYLSYGSFYISPSDLSDETGVFDDLNKDTVHLTDIESITYESYLGTTGELKYRAILKIRNSSKNKEDVIGVDARIYNPGATT